MLQGNKDLRELIDTAIATKDESLSETPEQVKVFAPGSPAVESFANEAVHRQSRVLEGLGLSEGFQGIVINGRVSFEYVFSDLGIDFTLFIGYWSF